MNCSLSKFYWLISIAITLLVIAIAVSYGWTAALPLFVAAGLVATVAGYLIPEIKQAVIDYAQCRGPSGNCSFSLILDTLGQAASTLSAVSFVLAGVMQIAALALIYSWILAWLGLSIQAAVAILVTAGQFSCAITILILIGVLTNTNSFKDCLDQQGGGTGVAIK